MTKLIRTTSKFKLPKRLSYPTGAEEISKYLKDVPQFEKLTLTFFESSRTFMSDFINDLKQKENITIVKCTFIPALSGPSVPRVVKHSLYDEDWSIYIYPIPHDKRHKVNLALKEDGFNEILIWFKTERNPTWKLSRKQFNVKYDLSKDMLNYSNKIDIR